MAAVKPLARRSLTVAFGGGALSGAGIDFCAGRSVGAPSATSSVLTPAGAGRVAGAGRHDNAGGGADRDGIGSAAAGCVDASCNAAGGVTA